MREILFRGKTKDRWVYGSLIDGIAGAVPVIVTTPNVDDSFRLEFDYDHVYPETIGQYTGLTDKNGRKIFEGDILPTDLERTYLIVEFRDGCFMFNCNDGGEDYYDIMLPILPEEQTVYKYGEVIGNIHDNPELLGGADNGE